MCYISRLTRVMNDAWKASFGGKRTFNASVALESRSRSRFVSPQSYRQQLDPVPSKALRKIIFQPRHHKCSLSEAQFVFSKRYGIIGWPEWLPTRNSATLTCGKSRRFRMRNRGSVDEQHLQVDDCTQYLNDILACMHQKSVRPAHHFQTLFKSCGDIKDKGYRHCFFITETPFLNPKPHDFRPLNKNLGPYSLRTLKTPDPFDLRFKTQCLTGNHCQPYHTGRHNKMSIEREIDKGPQFYTSKDHNSSFPSHLYFSKGRYSPAFSAHDAFLDRINKNIK